MANGNRPTINDALVLYHANRLPESEAAARQILAENPRHIDALNLIGVIAHRFGRHDVAIEWLTRAVAAGGNTAGIHNNLGEAWRALGEAGRALGSYEQAIALQPNNPLPQNNRAIVLAIAGRLDEAIAAWRELVQVCPRFPQAHNNLGNALLERGFAREAAMCHRRAVELDPSFLAAHSNYLRDLNHIPGVTPEQLLAEHQAWWNARVGVFSGATPPGRWPDPSRPLRLGFVSPDFREHSVAYFLLPLFAAHDRATMQIIAYSDVLAEDGYTAKLKPLADLWRPIRGAPDAAVAQQIRQDEVDVLIDLAGHTGENRLLIFAHRAAGVQVAWLGYPCTTGLPAIGYRLTDAQADPPGMTDAHFTEKLIRLPRTAWCYRPPESAPPVASPPAERNGFITFGSFNSFAKINEEVVAAWARILNVVPRSRLLLKANGLGEKSVQARLHAAFAQRGTAPDRLKLLSKDIETADHLNRYGEIDIALDTFPYNGTTTTCEALWMGVPVITAAGSTHMSRVGVSLLRSAGLAELIGREIGDYCRIAAGLAGDLPRLAELRRTMRQRLSPSPLRDEASFARDFEQTLRQIVEMHWKAAG